MRIRSVLAALAIGTIATIAAQAQATRTWVSGVGDDANPCSRSAPCKTFAGAISKTADGGEINVIDPGGFGGVTVTKSITIDGHNTEAGVLVSGTTGVLINASTSATVTLRGLDFHGLGTSPSGVRVLAAGNVNIEDCTIQGFTTAGVLVNGSTGGRVRLNIYNTYIRNNAGDGVQIVPTSPQFVVLSMAHSRAYDNTGSGVNIATNSNTRASITDNTLSTNGNTGTSQAGLVVQNGDVIATNNSISNNPFGLWTIAGTTRIGGNTMSGNTSDGIHISGGTSASFGDNYESGNTGNEIPNGTATKH